MVWILTEPLVGEEIVELVGRWFVGESVEYGSEIGPRFDQVVFATGNHRSENRGAVASQFAAEDNQFLRPIAIGRVVFPAKLSMLKSTSSM